MRWAGHVALIEMRNAYNILAGKLDGKRPFGEPRRRGKMIMERILREKGGKV
jgi:hypothetical protein